MEDRRSALANIAEMLANLPPEIQKAILSGVLIGMTISAEKEATEKPVST